MTNYDGIFADITPEMFAYQTTAVSTFTATGSAFVGEAPFDYFTRDKLANAVVVYGATFGQFNAMVTLGNAREQRSFVPQGNENLGLFLERCAREAQDLGATWMFLAKRHEGFMAIEQQLGEDDEVADTNSQEMLDTAHRQGAEEQVGILWFSERREAGGSEARHGVVGFDPQGRVTMQHQAPPQQSIGVFSMILDAVKR